MSEADNEMQLTCRLCGMSGDCSVFKLHEMMYATREEFDYFLCDNCGGLQICEIPLDLGRYYPPNYYSQAPRSEPPATGGIKHAILNWYCLSAATRPNSALEKLIRRVLPMPSDFASFGKYLVGANLRDCDDKILDVGCGSSPYILAALHRCGFHAVEGIDPFIAEDTQYFGIPIYCRTIEQMRGEYSLIMFHHSLEHAPDPVESLCAAASLLRPGGTCIVRIPVMDTYFWHTFGVNWVELDPPRHLYIMAIRTLELVAKKAGFRLRKIDFDSSGWELAASYRCMDGKPLRSTESEPDLKFDADRSRDFDLKAAELNRAGNAGRACFYLDKL